MLGLSFLGIIFSVILGLLAFKRPLYQAMLGGILAIILLYQVSPQSWLVNVTRVFSDWSILSVLVSLYLITYLQKILEEKQQLKLAERDLNQIFQNRRVTTLIGPLFIGLLPSAAAMILCGDIVKRSTQGYLAKEDQTFLTTWVRHIPEAFLPTYPAVLLMASLSGVPLASFMLAMLPIILFLLVVVYWKYIRHLPKTPDEARSISPLGASIQLLQHLWTLIVLLGLITLFHLQIVTASLLTIVLALLVYRIPPVKLFQFLRTAFEVKLLGNMFVVFVFKNFLDQTGILKTLPDLLQHFQLPTYLIFVLLFFLGGIISGASGIVVLGTPLAFAAIPTGGAPLMVLLMASAHAASQISPTHVCLTVAADYYQSSLLTLLKKTLPYSILTLAFAIAYYLVLNGG